MIRYRARYRVRYSTRYRIRHRARYRLDAGPACPSDCDIGSAGCRCLATG